VGHVACRGEIINALNILGGNMKVSDPPEDLGIDGKTILEGILVK
jgi:hypothetical protein